MASDCLFLSLIYVLYIYIYIYIHTHIYWRRRWHPTPVLLPGKSHGRRSLVGCSPWGHEESDTTEQLHFHFSLSCIGAGNGNPLQCSCLENPRDRGAWWAAVYGVTQSWIRLKWLSSSSNTHTHTHTHTYIYIKLCLIHIWYTHTHTQNMGFPGSSVVKNLPANAGDEGSIPGSWRSPGEGNGIPL